MEYFLYTVDLPSTNSHINYREINSKEQLTLVKANTFLPMEEDNLADYSEIIQNVISNCVKNKEDFNKIDLIDYMLFIVKLRIISIGNILELYFENPDPESKDDIKVSIDLNVFLELLYNASLEAMNNNIIEYKNIKVKLGWPNIKSEKIFYRQENKNSIENILLTIPEYITNITINNSDVIFNTLKEKEKIEIYERLPISLRAKIQEKILDSIKSLSEKNLFNIKKMDYFKFNFYNNSYQEFIRLLFSNNLRDIYKEYYILAAKRINPSYVDNLSIPERRVFCSFIEEEQKQMEENQSMDSVTTDSSTSIKDLMDEFGQ
jgi:hypothetical protein